MSEQQQNDPPVEQGATTPTPTPSDVAEAAGKGRPGETPEQTIEALRTALAKANAEAKEHRIKATELDEIKAAQMSDLEKAQSEAKRLADEATQSRAEALRWRIAAKHRISDEDAETFLTGSDEATLTRQAERLASLAATAAAPTIPVPDPSQGGAGGSGQTSLADQISAAEKSGDTQTALRLKTARIAEVASQH